MSTTTAPTRRCNRCAGTGSRPSPVMHLGVPGLCFDCNGARVVPQDFYKKRAADQRRYRERKDIAYALGAYLEARREARTDRLVGLTGDRRFRVAPLLRCYERVLICTVWDETPDAEVVELAARAARLLALPDPTTVTLDTLREAVAA